MVEAGVVQEKQAVGPEHHYPQEHKHADKQGKKASFVHPYPISDQGDYIRNRMSPKTTIYDPHNTTAPAMSCVRVEVTPIHASRPNAPMSWMLHAAVTRDISRRAALYAVYSPSLYRFRPAVFDIFGALPRVDMVSHSVMDLGLPDADTVDIYIHECAQEDLHERVPRLQPAIEDIISEARREYRHAQAERDRLASMPPPEDPPRPYEPALDPEVIEETERFHADTYGVFAQHDEFTRRLYVLHYYPYE